MSVHLQIFVQLLQSANECVLVLLAAGTGFRERLSSLLLFEHYNTRIVLLGATLLGLADRKSTRLNSSH